MPEVSSGKERERRAPQVERVVFTLMVAAIGGLLGVRLKLPAGALIGAMISVAFVNLAFGYAGQIPNSFRIAAQIVVGGILGLSITRETVASVRGILLPATVLVIAMISLGLIAGFILHRLTGVDLATALFSSSPGGMTEMILASMGFGADTPTVALLQLLRMISIVSIMPLVLRLVLKK